MNAKDNALKQALDACRGLLVSAAVFSAAVNLLYLAPSLYMMQVYDRVLESGSLATLVFISAILLFALVVLAHLDSLRARLLGRFSLRLERLFAPRLLEAALRIEGAADGKRRQVMRMFDTLRTTLSGPGMVGIMDAPWIPIFVAASFLIHPLIGLVALAGGAILVAIAIVNERAHRRRLGEIGDLAPRLYAQQEAEDAVGPVARSLGMRGTLIARQLKRRASLNEIQRQAQFANARYSGATKLVRLVLQSMALGVGAWLAVEQQISPGALIAGSILTARALAPLEQIVGAWRQLGEAHSAYRTIREVLATSSPEQARTPLPSPQGALRVENISVRLGGDRFALRDVSIKVAPGEVLGLLGPSGAGKSTLARVMAGAAAPDAGTVRLDGANMLDWDPDLLGAHVGYVPQEVALMAGTIAENIKRFMEGDDNLHDAVSAARAAGAHDMILRLPKGYDTELGLGGFGLSFGQAQRVALARALFGAPVLLVLDEPNAHLDQEGELALLAAIQAAKARGAATIIVAHRASVLGVCDRLAVLREGRLEMIGDRNEVLAKLGGAPSASSASARERDMA